MEIQIDDLILSEMQKGLDLINVFINGLTDAFDPRDYEGKEDLFIAAMLSIVAAPAGTIINKLSYIYKMSPETLLSQLNRKIALAVKIKIGEP